MKLQDFLAGKKAGELKIPFAIELATDEDGELLVVDGSLLARCFDEDDNLFEIVPVPTAQLLGKVVPLEDGSALLVPVEGARFVRFLVKGEPVFAITFKAEQTKVSSAATAAAAKLFATATAPAPVVVTPPVKEPVKTTGLKA